MKPAIRLKHEFVKYIPEHLDERTLYVSFEYATAAHKCCCGCGNDVFTPLSPTDWRLIYDGVSITLEPSIGNWGFPCQSHYWIRDDTVRWAPRLSRHEILAGRARDRWEKENYFGSTSTESEERPGAEMLPGEQGSQRKPLWRRLKKWLF